MFFGFDWYLLQLIVPLKPDFNCLSNFALSEIDKFTTATQSFASVNTNLLATANQS